MIAHISKIYARPLSEEPCRPRYLVVHIHESVEEMHRAALKHGCSESEFAGAAALFTPTQFRCKYDRSKRRWEDTTSACAGVIRLCNGYLESEIIVHESVHAAIHIWRLHAWWAQVPDHENPDPAVDVGEIVGVVEESFAYAVGSIAGAAGNIVHEYLKRRAAQHD